MVFERVESMKFRIEPRCQFAGVLRGSGRIVAEVSRQQNSLNFDGHLASPVLVRLLVGHGKPDCIRLYSAQPGLREVLLSEPQDASGVLI